MSKHRKPGSRNKPRILSPDQIKRAIAEGKQPFIIWKEPHGNPDTAYHEHTYSKKNKRVAWALGLEDCQSTYPKHKGWICRPTTNGKALSYYNEIREGSGD